MQPVRRPAVCAKVRPWPSWASKVLISRAVPSVCESRVTLPSVIVPSTSIRSSLICAARFLSAGEIVRVPARKTSQEKGKTDFTLNPNPSQTRQYFASPFRAAFEGRVSRCSYLAAAGQRGTLRWTSKLRRRTPENKAAQISRHALSRQTGRGRQCTAWKTREVADGLILREHSSVG